MSEQTTKKGQSSTSAPPAKETKAKDLKNEELEKSTEEVKDAIDELIEDKTEEIDLIDEIDAVLEENAEEFVKNYVQRGGE
jgi:ubiquitin-like protein Pup